MPLFFITCIEVYGDRPALNRYIVGKRKNLLIAFSSNLRFFFDITLEVDKIVFS